MVKKVLILVCFLIVLSGIGIVNALTLENTTVYSQTGYQTPTNRFYLADITAFNDTYQISRVEFEGMGYRRYNTSFPASGSETVTISTTTDVMLGNATITWSVPALYPEDPAAITINIDILDFDRGMLTGFQNLKFDFGSNSNIMNTYEGMNIISYTDASGGDWAGSLKLEVGGTYSAGGTYRYYSGSSITASFICVPTSQYPDADVVCTDTTVGATSWLWSIDAEAMGIEGWQTSTSQNLTWQSHYNGLYSVNLRVNNADWENKTNYVEITDHPSVTPTPTPVPTIPPGYVRSNVWVMDHLGNIVHGVDISMRDVEGAVWSNSTSDPDGTHYIDTLPYHTLNLYADFTVFPGEFLSASLLGVETGYSGHGYYLVLYPTAAPAGEGNVNLYITVTDEDTAGLIRDAALTVTHGTLTAGGTTGNSGTGVFVVPNQTNIRITASKLGYTSVTQYLNSGPGPVENAGIELSRVLITTVPTGTVPPGGLTIPPTQDPNDPALTGSTNAKGQEIMNWLAMNGMDLVQLCFLVTILGLLGIKIGGK